MYPLLLCSLSPLHVPLGGMVIFGLESFSTLLHFFSLCSCRQVMPCSCLVKLQLLLMVTSSLPSFLCFWCTCLLLEHGKLKKPWTQDKQYLATTKMCVANFLLILKTKHSTVPDSGKNSKKVNFIPAENVSRCDLTVCSLRFQQITLLLRLQSSKVNKEHTKL